MYTSCMYNLHFFLHVCRAPVAEGSFSHYLLTFGCEASKGAVGTLRRMSGSRPSNVAAPGGFNFAELALEKGTTFRLAEPSR